MDTKFDFGNAVPSNIVYVKPIAVASLPAEVRNQVHGAETLYGVFREDGEQLALVANRKLAFVLARQHDMSPVTVH